jgi:MEDS: MEthanogen/methylotroph, DcmR Sensory domain
MNPRQKAVRLFGEDLPESPHLCAFFRTSDERYRVLMPFIREGLEHGDKAVHIVNPAFRSHHTQRMAEAGIDAAQAEVTGQLEIIGWFDGPLRGGRFNKSEWLASLPAVLNNGRTQGFAMNRFIADMQWLLNKPDVLDQALEFECLANLALPKAGDVVICAYDLDKFGAEMVINALRTHPMVIIGGMVQHNPFYVPPEELLKELSEGDSSEQGLSAGA